MPHAEHHHYHVHSPETPRSLNTAFITGIALNTVYVIAEAVWGFVYGSMGLLADAGHNLSDIASLTIAMVAYRLMTRKADSRHTYGYKKFTVQASFVNALLLYAAVGAILVESISKLLHPSQVNGDAIAWVAALGVVVNGVTAGLFMKDKGHDINIKGAFLHMAADTLVSVGVVVSGIVIHFTGWYILDPIIGIVIAAIIAWSTRSLLVESTRMSIDAVPESVNIGELEKAMQKVDGVDAIYHLHVWPLSTTENAMTVHALISDVSRLNQIVASIKQQARKFGVCHSTVEVEVGTGTSCRENHQMFNND